MTVADLIDYLQQFDGDTPVVLTDDHDGDDVVVLAVAIAAWEDHNR